MSFFNLSKELAVAETAALLAGHAVRGFYGTVLTVTHKNPTQPLTEADLAANDIIIKNIQEHFPDDGILSEELADNQERLLKNRVWIIDPIDGTKEFIEGIPEFAISIGLAINGHAVLGIVYNPVTRELFSAAQGLGCRLNDIPFQIPEHPSAPFFLATSRTETDAGLWDGIEAVHRLQAVGSIAYKMALVAAGKFDASFTLVPKSEWDICAGAALIQAAGGHVSTADNQEVRFNNKDCRLPSLLYGAKSTSAKLLQFIAENNLVEKTKESKPKLKKPLQSR